MFYDLQCYLERRGWYVEKFFRKLWYQFFGGPVSSDDLHGLSRVPFVGLVDVFSRFLFELQLIYSKMVISYGCFVFT